MRDIEAKVGVPSRPRIAAYASMRSPRTVSWGQVLHVLLHRYRRRTVLGLTLMASQAFFYNAIFFTYALVLSRFHGVPEAQVGYYIFPFAVGQLPRPAGARALLRRGRPAGNDRLTYAVSGVGLFFTGYLFSIHA